MDFTPAEAEDHAVDGRVSEDLSVGEQGLGDLSVGEQASEEQTVEAPSESESESESEGHWTVSPDPKEIEPFEAYEYQPLNEEALAHSFAFESAQLSLLDLWHSRLMDFPRAEAEEYAVEEQALGDLSLEEQASEEQTVEALSESESEGHWTVSPDPEEIEPFEAYDYEPLNETNNEIRLLTILPRKVSSPPRILLTTTVFSSAHVPTFEALSYTWGSPDNPLPVFVGNAGSDAILVTQNLAEALPYLQYDDEERIIWIDALCVNQQDLEERSSQVKRMAEIYTKATRVVVWLGPEADGSPNAIGALKEMSGKIDVDNLLDLHCISEDTSDSHWADIDAPLPFNNALIWSIAAFVSRPWFERLWIWQEIRLTSKTSIVMCGSDVIDWAVLRKGLVGIARKGLPLPYINPDRLQLIVNLCNFELNFSFPGLIQQTALSRCSDAKDRVYALLSLLPESNSMRNLEPDYSKDTYDIYMDVVLRCIDSANRLTILESAEMCDEEIEKPSWVPDWSVSETPLPMWEFPASLCSRAITCHQDRHLHVTGVYVDTIIATRKLDFTGDTGTIILELQELARQFGIEHIDPNSTLLKAFCLTLCADRTSDRYPEHIQGLYTRLQILESISRLLNPHTCAEDLTSHDHRIQTDHLNYVCSGRTLFKTRAGHMGLGPRLTAIGDIVTVFLGSEQATILRPIPQTSNDHLLIGSGYCHGFMDGEAFLGSLPDQVEMRRYQDAEGYDWWNCVDLKTGNRFVEDPRMGSLPEQWKIKGHDKEEFWTWFVNVETGEAMEERRDPRFFDAVKAHGVDLKEFVLV